MADAILGANVEVLAPPSAEPELVEVPKRLPTVDMRRWIGHAPPEREWVVVDWLPARQATLLTGAGAVGKSLLAQQLCTCVALGLPFLGTPVRAGPALYVSCEDDEEELWRRQASICEALGVEIADVVGKLTLSSLMGLPGNALAHFDAVTGEMRPTDRYREVEGTCVDGGIRFAAIDNASHLMGGDHNDLTQVVAFLNLANGLALRIDGATLVLHHPNKKGDHFLGSVGWENQVRSRLFMSREGDIDPDARKLINPKANYASGGGDLAFRWIKGAFLTAADLPADRRHDFEESARAGADNAIFLACLAEMTRQQRAVSDKRSATFAPTRFATMPEAKGIGKERLDAAMDRLFRIAKIEKAELWRGADRKPVFGLRVTAGDGRAGEIEQSGETSLKPAENGQFSLRDTHCAGNGAGNAGDGG